MSVIQTTADAEHEISIMSVETSRFQLDIDRRAEAGRRRRLVREFVQARQAERICLQFRPRISLRNGEILGAEATLRWQPRRQTRLHSNALFALAEWAGEAASLGGWALREACSYALRWPGDTTLVSVRIPPSLQRTSLLNLHLSEALETSGLPPERLELRLAEPDLAELGPDELLGLCAIRDLGVGVALEHFGIGATSLALLRRLPLSTITFSASLSSHVPDDREDSAIMRAILAASRALGLESVANAVQNEAQRSFLADAGCDAAQGGLMGQEMTQGDFIARLNKA